RHYRPAPPPPQGPPAAIRPARSPDARAIANSVPSSVLPRDQTSLLLPNTFAARSGLLSPLHELIQQPFRLLVGKVLALAAVVMPRDEGAEFRKRRFRAVVGLMRWWRGR